VLKRGTAIELVSEVHQSAVPFSIIVYRSMMLVLSLSTGSNLQYTGSPGPGFWQEQSQITSFPG
jgi:hypothetical protein